MSVSRALKYFLLSVFALATSTHRCSADITLLVEDPVGRIGFFSNAGHSAIWISDACLQNDGSVTICNTGGGVIFSKMSGWKAYGYGVILASMYFYGSTVDGTDAIPYGDTDNELRVRFWNRHLAAIYPLVTPERGSLMLAHAFRRRIYLLRLKTSEAEDAAALVEIHRRLGDGHYHTWTNNCTDFTRSMLDIYFPGEFRRQWHHNFAITTPEALGDRTEKFARKYPERDLTIGRLRPDKESFFFSRRTQDPTGTLLFDWKYAVPLAVVSPVAYASVGVMHLLDDGLHIGGSFRRHAKAVSNESMARYWEPDLEAQRSSAGLP